MNKVSKNEELKRSVGIKAADLIKNDMRIGVGTGSTVAYFTEELGKRIKQGLSIQAVPTSFQSKFYCLKYGIPLLEPIYIDHLDIVVDGADEIDGSLNLVKGGGAAQTNEKIIASMADQFVVIADHSKLVDKLCKKIPLPLEILPGSLSLVTRRIKDLGGEPVLREGLRKDGPVITDNGNFILDISFNEAPKDLKCLDIELKNIPGVLETGLFLGLADKALIGKSNEIVVLYANDKK